MSEFDIKSLQQQISDLKAEIVELSAGMPSSLNEAQRAARPAIDAAGKRLEHAARVVGDQGRAAVGTIRENPGTVTSVAVTAALFGVLVGYFISSSSAPPQRRFF